MEKLNDESYSLNSSFEIKGDWSFPGSKHSSSGILFYSQEEIRLELFSTLNSNDCHTSDVIWGISTSGEEITLLSTTLINSTTVYTKHVVKSEKYIALELFIGHHFIDIKDTYFCEMEVEFTYFTEWRGAEIFLHSFDSKNSDKSIHINEPDPLKIEIPFIDAKLVISDLISREKGNYKNIEFTSNSSLKLISNNMQSFEWFQKQLYSLQKLMTVLTGRSVHILDLALIMKNYEYDGYTDTSYLNYPECKWFIKQGTINLETNVNEYSFLMAFKDVKSDFETIVNKWFESEDKLGVVYDLFVGVFFETVHSTIRFNNLMQSVEAFHRRSQTGILIEIDDFNIFLDGLNKYIKDTAPIELKDKLMGTVKYSNQFTLKNRLQELTDSLSLESKQLIFGDEKRIKGFLRKLVETRNYFTHYDEKGKSNIIEDERSLHAAIHRLLAFMNILIFRELGIEEQYIVERFVKNTAVKHALLNANSVLNN